MLIVHSSSTRRTTIELRLAALVLVKCSQGGSKPKAFAQSADHALGDSVAVIQARAAAGDPQGDRRGRRPEAIPRQAHHPCEEFLEGAGVEGHTHPGEDAAGGPQPAVGCRQACSSVANKTPPDTGVPCA